jgi:transposase-like protein
MKPVMLALVTVAACASSPRPPTSPEMKTTAMQMYCEGASIDDVARSLEVDREQARAIIHVTLVDLNRRYYRGR